MPSNIKKLEEICTFINGGAWNQTEYVNDGIPVVQVTNLQNGSVTWEKQKFLPPSSLSKYEKNVLQTHDLVIATVGSHPTQPGSVVGRASIIPEHASGALLNQNAVCVRPIDDTLDKRFLGYLGKSPQMRNYIVSRAKGAANQVRLAIGALKQFEFELPSIYEQRRVAGILSAYDDLIDNNNRRIALLEEAIHRLYREWFVHLRFPGHEHTPVVAGVPEGWEKRPLGEVCNLTMGQSPKSEFYNTHGEGLPFHQGVKDFSNRFVTHTTWCTQPNRIAESGDILFSVRAPVGRINVASDKLIIGRGLAAIRNKRNFQSFQLYQLKTQFFKEDMIGGGAIFASVTKNQLSQQSLLVPSDRVLEDFERIAAPVDQQIANLSTQNIKLAEARDALLPRLMNGSLPV